MGEESLPDLYDQLLEVTRGISEKLSAGQDIQEDLIRRALIIERIKGFPREPSLEEAAKIKQTLQSTIQADSANMSLISERIAQMREALLQVKTYRNTAGTSEKSIFDKKG